MAKNNIINWEAYEYIERKKNIWWYVCLFTLDAILITLCIFLISELWSFLILIIMATIALLVYTQRKPRLLHYSLNDKGISEGNNLYTFSQFKSFGILEENNHYCIVLTPIKKFGMSVSIYFPESEGEQIVDMFGARLPMEPVKLDLIDRLVRILRI